MSLLLRRLLTFRRTSTNRKIIFRKSYYTDIREPAQPLKGKEPKWTTAAEAFVDLKSNNTVVSHAAGATPIELLDAMSEFGKSNNLKNIKVCHMHSEGNSKYHDPAYKEHFRSCSFFMGGNVRKPVAEGRADTIPLFLSEIPLLFYKKIIQPDIVLIHVSPPDRHGFCSLGISVDCIRAAVIHAKIIIALVNKQMPRTFGDSLVHVSHIDYAVIADRPLYCLKPRPLSDVEAKIGALIAEQLVDNGATLQMGIGTIPDAVLSKLTGHKNLGVHSEMFADGIVDLAEAGCITNNFKTMHQGRIVGSFLLGSQKLYDFVNDNPLIEMLRVDYVNHTKIISQQPKMTAINSCLEVDLTGQVNSDSIGTRMYSGFGGQVDFIRGSAEGFDGLGKPIIAFPSITKKGESKIVPVLHTGAGVVTTRGHVHYIVTEYGITDLFGKTLRQRAHGLINIAHPNHRKALEKAAFERLKCMPAP